MLIVIGLGLLALLTGSPPETTRAQDSGDPWAPIRFLLGSWRGDAPGEVHEDWGFFSHDRDRSRLLLRQFLSEGFVNTYVLDAIEQDGRVLVLTTESTENAGGTRGRLRYTIESEDAYELVLELAPPGKDFVGCQSMQMRRVE